MESIIVLSVFAIVISVLILSKLAYGKFVKPSTESKPEDVQFMCAPCTQRVAIGDFSINVQYDMSGNLKVIFVSMGETRIHITKTTQTINVGNSFYQATKTNSFIIYIENMIFEMIDGKNARDILLLKKRLTAVHNDDLTCPALLAAVVEELVLFGMEYCEHKRGE